MCWKCGGTEIGAKAKARVYEQRECAVCFGINGDTSLKECYYCHACNEWICKECETKWLHRGMVALKKQWFKFFK